MAWGEASSKLRLLICRPYAISNRPRSMLIRLDCVETPRPLARRGYLARSRTCFGIGNVAGRVRGNELQEMRDGKLDWSHIKIAPSVAQWLHKECVNKHGIVGIPMLAIRDPNLGCARSDYTLTALSDVRGKGSSLATKLEINSF
jgi:hypothetical protein